METTTQRTSLVDYYNSLETWSTHDITKKDGRLRDRIGSLLIEEIIESHESPSFIYPELKGYSLDDFRSTFEWDEHHYVVTEYDMVIENYDKWIDCSSKEEVMKYLNGETSVDEYTNVDPDECDIECFGLKSVRPNISVDNIRLKEQVSNQFVVTLKTTDTDFSLETLKGLLPSNVEVCSSTPIEG